MFLVLSIGSLNLFNNIQNKRQEWKVHIFKNIFKGIKS